MGGKSPDPDGHEAERHTGQDIDPAENHLAGAKKGQSLQAERGEGRETAEETGENQSADTGTRIPQTALEQQFRENTDAEGPDDIHQESSVGKTSRPSKGCHPLGNQPAAETSKSPAGHNGEGFPHIRGIVMPRWPMYFPARSA